LSLCFRWFSIGRPDRATNYWAPELISQRLACQKSKKPMSGQVKVRTFWEAHIIWKNLPHGLTFTKGQIKPKADWRAIDSPKKQTKEFGFFAITVRKYLKLEISINQLICQNHDEDLIKFCVFLRKSELYLPRIF